ncbi:MAG: NAD(P)/FAD-dependent oxidoreductase [Rhodobacteraceae bacterium]|nr:NAD(P)/FAD-dependent oxidoreductase [Paracoccaceae bacterium]
MDFDVVVIGAGAAGLMCAIEAGRRGRKVALLDHAKKIGEKIRISGGGRCNFTNRQVSKENFISSNPSFCISILKKYTPQDFIERISSHGIQWHEKKLGQLFCNGSSKEIIEMLRDELVGANVTLILECKILEVKLTNRKYNINTSKIKIISDNLVIATGGKSIPKMGATDLGYKIAESFGINLINTKPALVPLTFAPGELKTMSLLSGNSVFASASNKKISFTEGLLFTHRGLSGPSILQISSYWNEGETITIDLLNEHNILNLLIKLRTQNGKISIKNAVARFLPTKIAELILDQLDVQGNLGDQSNLTLEAIRQAIHDWNIKPTGSEGYRTAEVTLGGVDTKELDSRTMETKKIKGLYFIGEVVDVTGWLGGYNFQWAWSSGWVSGQAV